MVPKVQAEPSLMAMEKKVLVKSSVVTIKRL